MKDTVNIYAARPRRFVAGVTTNIREAKKWEQSDSGRSYAPYVVKLPRKKGG